MIDSVSKLINSLIVSIFEQIIYITRKTGKYQYNKFLKQLRFNGTWTMGRSNAFKDFGMNV